MKYNHNDAQTEDEDHVPLRIQMKDLAHALMGDVADQYEKNDPKELFNALQRLKTGAEAMKDLSATALVLDTMQMMEEHKP